MIRRGTTPTLKIRIDGIGDDAQIDSILFSIPSASGIIVKTYPGEVDFDIPFYKVRYSQQETLDMPAGRTTLEAQINLVGGVVKSAPTIVSVADSQYTEIMGPGTGDVEDLDVLMLVTSVIEGGGGQNGATFTPVPTTPQPDTLNLAWENDKGLPNPPAVSIVAPAGKDGDGGKDGAPGPAGKDGLTTSVTVNGETHTQTGGNVDLGELAKPDLENVSNADFFEKGIASGLGQATIPEIQPTAEVYVTGTDASGRIILSESKPAVPVSIPLTITTSGTAKTLRYIYKEDGVISALSRFSLVLQMESMETSREYEFSATMVANAGGTDYLIGGNLYSNRYTISNPRVEVPLENNVLPKNLNRKANDYLDISVVFTKSGGGADTAYIVSSALQPSKLVRNGGDSGTTNVIDFNGIDTQTQSYRNRFYEGNKANISLDNVKLKTVYGQDIRGDGDITAPFTIPLPVSEGGTGRTTQSAHSLLAGGTTSTGVQQSITNGAADTILKSNGSSALPSFATPKSLGLASMTDVYQIYNQIYLLMAPNYFVLYSGNWDLDSQTYTIYADSVDQNILDFGLPSPSDEGNRDAFAEAGLWLSASDSYSFTISCKNIPTQDIEIAVRGVGL